ncbi:MAG: MFS transporter [Treponema sp.]|jgi:PPP family 3-phenylpropionic acid transporter|nr:MFS transporter [Treponema sp.]
MVFYFWMGYTWDTVYWGLAFIGTFLLYGVLSPYISILIRDYGYSHSVLGILLALCEAAAIGSPFVMSFFADRFRCYRPVMLTSLFITLFCGIILFVSKNLLICAVILPFLSFGYRAVQPLTDAISTIQLGKDGNYGKYRAVGSITFFIAVVFLQYTPVVPPNSSSNIAFWVIVGAAISIILMMIIPKHYFINNDMQATAATGTACDTKITRHSRVKIAVQRHGATHKLLSPLFIIGFSIIFFNRLAMSPVNSFMSLYVVEYLKWDAVGLMWALSSGSEIAFIFLSKRLIRRFKAMPLMAFATAAILARYAIILLFPSKTGIVLSQLTHSVCFGIFHPAAVSFIASCVPPAQRALGMSLYLSLGTGVPTLLGNFAGGFIVEYLGYPELFMLFSIFAILGLVIYFITQKHTLRLSTENT